MQTIVFADPFARLCYLEDERGSLIPLIALYEASNGCEPLS